MSESRPIGERLARLAVAHDDSDWDDVLRRAGLAGSAPAARPRRRLSVPARTAVAAAAALLVVAGAALAASGDLPWWQSGAPPLDPQAVVSVARDNLPARVKTAEARTVARAGNAALVAVPLDETGYCVIPVLGGHASMGAQCEYQVADPPGGADDILRAYPQPAGRPGGPAWVVYGRITDPRAAALDLGAAGGASFRIALHTGGFFVATVPAARWASLAGRAGAGSILDPSGAVLRRGCVSWGPSPSSPGAGETDTILWRDGSGSCTATTTQPPPAPQPELARARPLVQFTLSSQVGRWTAGTTIALWRAPNRGGGTCIFEAKAGEQPTPYPAGPNPAYVAACYPTAPFLAGRPIQVGLSSGREVSGAYSHLVSGAVDPSSGITRIELRGAGTTARVAFANGWFFGQLPDGSSADLPPGGPWLVVGLDSSGKEIAQVDLNRFQAQAEPH